MKTIQKLSTENKEERESVTDSMHKKIREITDTEKKNSTIS